MSRAETPDTTGLREAVEALVAEYRATGHEPAPYTQEAALIERLEGVLAAHPTPDASPDPAVVTPDAGDVGAQFAAVVERVLADEGWVCDPDDHDDLPAPGECINCDAERHRTGYRLHDAILASDWLAARDRAVAKAAGEREREQWVDRLTVLCDDEWLRRRDRAMDEWLRRRDRAMDEWLRRRDRAMELLGVVGEVVEHGPHTVRGLLPRARRSALPAVALDPGEYGGRHESYMRWLRAGRDEGTAREEGRA